MIDLLYSYDWLISYDQEVIASTKKAAYKRNDPSINSFQLIIKKENSSINAINCHILLQSFSKYLLQLLFNKLENFPKKIFI